jgi:hypothetical protein
MATCFDVVALFALGLAAEYARFTWQQGRHVISADSVQYVDGAEALLGKHETAHFGFRKPGYSILLAGSQLLFGNMAWGAVVINHLLQALLVPIVYAWGRRLHGRSTGWVAALLLIARLYFEHRTARIMSECAYATTVTLSLLWLTAGLERGKPPSADASERIHRPRLIPLFGAGSLLGLSWLLRSVAVAPIAAGLLAIGWTLRGRMTKAVGGLFCFLAPIACCVGVECELNRRFAGRFRPGTGTFGPALVIRLRATDGMPLTNSQAAHLCLGWLPEREPGDAFAADKLDGWVAWYRAVHDHGLDEWQVDAIMRRAGWEMLIAQPGDYLTGWGRAFLRHLLRQGPVPTLDRGVFNPPPPALLPEGIVPTAENRALAFAYWALPRRSLHDASTLVQRVQADSLIPAPMSPGPLGRTLRYASLHPTVSDGLAVFRHIGSLWPGWALVVGWALGLNRRTCGVLALVYWAEAAAVATTVFSDADLQRFQFVWLGTDTALTAGLLGVLASRLRSRA